MNPAVVKLLELLIGAGINAIAAIRKVAAMSEAEIDAAIAVEEERTEKVLKDRWGIE